MAQEIPRVGVATIILTNYKKVLLGKRIDKKNPHGDGRWQFPGGHLHYGESFKEGALREVIEETGLDVEINSENPLHVTNDISEISGTHYTTLFFEATHVSGVPRVMEPEKCESWKWYDWSDLPEPLFLPIQNLIKQGYSPFRK